jgi:hypothetical protein
MVSASEVFRPSRGSWEGSVLQQTCRLQIEVRCRCENMQIQSYQKVSLFASLQMHARAACLFLRLIADSKTICTSSVWAGAWSSHTTPISQLRSICDGYINTIGEHAQDLDSEDPRFIFKNFSKYDTHILYPGQIHLSYHTYRLKFKLLNFLQKSCKFIK